MRVRTNRITNVRGESSELRRRLIQYDTSGEELVIHK
jgi:hypothetical protein